MRNANVRRPSEPALNTKALSRPARPVRGDVPLGFWTTPAGDEEQLRRVSLEDSAVALERTRSPPSKPAAGGEIRGRNRSEKFTADAS